MRTASFLMIAAVTMLAGCGGGASKTGRPDPAPGGSAAPVSPAQPRVPTASKPSNACGWISAAEVERTVGPLTGNPVPVMSVGELKPRERGGACLYQLAAHPRPDLLERRNRFREAMKHNPEGVQALKEIDSAKEGEINIDEIPAVVVEVMLDGWQIGEGAAARVEKSLARAAGASPPGGPSDKPDAGSASSGWDYEGSLFVYRMYRQGHVAISLRATVGIETPTLSQLAVKVREQIPDLPFPSVENGIPSGPDPCSLLTAAEAETVLGKLLVPPYRSLDNSFANSAGAGCAYFTAGHRALVVRPTWSGGKEQLTATRGIGALVGTVAGREAPIPSGPWDKAAAMPGTGSAVFLKGDRTIEMFYGFSSTDRDGVLKLAAFAVQRLTN